MPDHSQQKSMLSGEAMTSTAKYTKTVLAKIEQTFSRAFNFEKQCHMLVKVYCFRQTGIVAQLLQLPMNLST